MPRISLRPSLPPSAPVSCFIGPFIFRDVPSKIVFIVEEFVNFAERLAAVDVYWDLSSIARSPSAGGRAAGLRKFSAAFA